MKNSYKHIWLDEFEFWKNTYTKILNGGILEKLAPGKEARGFEDFLVDLFKTINANGPADFVKFFLGKILNPGFSGINPDVFDGPGITLGEARWACIIATALSGGGFLLEEVAKVVDELEAVGSQGWYRESLDFGERFRIRAILTALILGDFARAESLFNKWSKFRHQKVHFKALQKLIKAGKEGVANSSAFEEFQAYFDEIRNPSYENHKDESWDPYAYPHACGLLIERIQANWQGEPNWKNITAMVSY